MIASELLTYNFHECIIKKSNSQKVCRGTIPVPPVTVKEIRRDKCNHSKKLTKP